METCYAIMSITAHHSVKPSTLRVRRHRQRRRSGMRLFTVEVPKATIGDTITRGLLPEDGTKPWTVIQACYAGLLSDATLTAAGLFVALFLSLSTWARTAGSWSWSYDRRRPSVRDHRL